jgi:threonine/homoserine/homoserine lactone efflux protein
MLDVISSTLTSAVAIAISPIPIIAVILMLMTPRATRLGVSFLVAWFLGIVLATTVAALLSGVLPEPSTNESQPVLGAIMLAIGAGLLFLGWRQWRSRLGPSETAELPAWMTKIDGLRTPAAFGLGFALAAVNPKNLLVAASAGAVIGRSGLPVGEFIAVVAVFSGVAALSVLLPVLTMLVVPRVAVNALDAIRTWLTDNNATIMTVLLAVIGVNVIGKGLGLFA